MHLTQSLSSKSSLVLLQSNFTLVNLVQRTIVNILPSITFLLFSLSVHSKPIVIPAPPTFGNTGAITICVNGSYFLNPSTTNGTFSSGNAAIATVNSSGYVTGVSEGTTTVSFAATSGGTVTATVTVAANANPSLTISDPLAQSSYKFSNNPQGPVGGIINYVGYNGYNYSSQARPTNTGFFRASKQLGNNAGCPYEYYIFRCTTCGTVPEYAIRPQGTFSGNTIQSGTGYLTYTSTNGGGPYFTVVYVPSGGSNVSIPNITSGGPFSLGTFTSTTSYNLISVTDQNTKASTDFSGTTATISVVPPPTASLTGAQSICAGATANLSLRTTGTGAITVTLNNGLVVSTISGTTNISVTPTISTTYSIASVSDISGSGTVGGSSATVTVNPLTAISVQPLSTVTLVEGATVTLSVTATNATTYQWYKGGVAISSANSSTYTTANTISGAGTYYVTVTGTCNTVNSGNAVVSVYPRPQGTLVGSVVSQGVTGKLTYTSSNSPTGGPFTIVYLPSGGSNVTVTNVTSGVAFDVASGTPSTTTTYSLVSVKDETTTISRTSGFTTTTATINIIEVINYGQVTSAGGRIWLDRNLGASRVATSLTDAQGYGDYYQWGRPADGHQIQYKINNNSSGVTNVRSSTSIPSHGLWIQSDDVSHDWLITPDNSLWTGANPTNNVCPVGFRIPTLDEWYTEKNSWISSNAAGGFASPLKLTLPGMLTYFGNEGAQFTAKDDFGQYLTQSAYTYNAPRDRYGGAVYFGINSGNAWDDDNYTKMQGMSVRCIMNVTTPVLTSTISSTITSSSAILGGVLSSTGGATTSVGIIYSTDINFTTSSTITVTSNASVGNVTTTITGLAQLTTYYAKSYATNSAGTIFGSTISLTTDALTVGASYQGGKIFYIFQQGDLDYVSGQTHGLIATTADISTGTQWGCSGTDLPGASGTAIGTGNQNTIDIMAGCSTAGIAARLCGDLVQGGYSDWYLPSKDELEKLYLNRTAIGGFTNNLYWSSSETEFDNLQALYVNFVNGAAGYGYKTSTYYVRAIRAF